MHVETSHVFGQPDNYMAFCHYTRLHLIPEAPYQLEITIAVLWPNGA